MIILALLVGALEFAWVGRASSETEVSIPHGAGVHAISGLLREHAVIENPLVFEAVVWLAHAGGALKAGEYRFPAHSTIAMVVQQLRTGGRDNGLTVRLVESSNAREMAVELARVTGISPDEFLAIVHAPASTLLTSFPWLPPVVRSVGLEGYLFPDTYQFLEDTRPEEMVRAMLSNFAHKVLPMTRDGLRGYPLDLHGLMTLSSVVEREVATWEDRRIVADIFLRRMRAGIPLQADSTVNYATGKSRSRVSLEDLRNPSLYNTYQYLGLPPGPIGNPSLLTIRAVLSPVPNPYWYFLSDRDGVLYYSQTFAEHVGKKTAIYGQ